MWKKGLAAGMVALGLLTAFALLAGVVLGNDNAVTALSNTAALEVAPPLAVSVVGPSIIGFESDPAGSKAEPFTSVDNPLVHFVDSIGNDLSVNDRGPLTNGQGLFVDFDDASALVLLFDVPTTKVAMAFGNDDPGIAQPGDRATLTVFRNGTRIKTVHVTMNLNNTMDQTIQYSGTTAVDKATLVYDRAGTPIKLTEVVDDISLRFAFGIKGNSGNNTLKGNFLPDGISGGGGADTIIGRGGNDVIAGGSGADVLDGNDGNDLIDAGLGNDSIRTTDGVGGNDTVYGGPGTDTAIIDAGDTTQGVEMVIVQ